MSDTPKFGTPEFWEAVKKHDEEADPKREEKGLKYTKKPAETKPAAKSKPAAKPAKKPAKGDDGKGGKKGKK
jgi:hypothetical protein